MDIKNLREWVNKLPKSFDNFSIVVSKEDKGEELTYRLDMPVRALSIDESTNEANIFITEDAGAPGGAATLDAGTGMGAPELAGRDIEGSGDVPSDGKKKKKKKKKRKVSGWDEFFTR